MMKSLLKIRVLVLVFALVAMALGFAAFSAPSTQAIRCDAWCMYCTLYPPYYCWCECCMW